MQNTSSHAIDFMDFGKKEPFTKNNFICTFLSDPKLPVYSIKKVSAINYNNSTGHLKWDDITLDCYDFHDCSTKKLLLDFINSKNLKVIFRIDYLSKVRIVLNTIKITGEIINVLFDKNSWDKGDITIHQITITPDKIENI